MHLTGLCECGCGERTNLARATIPERGWVKGRPLRYCRGHNNRKSPVEYLVDGDTGCWVWQRAVLKTGYGSLRRAGRTLRAHRAYYEDRFGCVPDGLVLDHLCRNKLCVNPEHLEPVTRAENSRRAIAKLDRARVDEIRRRLSLGVHPNVLADRFGVSPAAIYNIRSGARWAAA